MCIHQLKYFIICKKGEMKAGIYILLAVLLILGLVIGYYMATVSTPIQKGNLQVKSADVVLTIVPDVKIRA